MAGLVTIFNFVEGDEEALRLEITNQDLNDFSSIKLRVRRESGILIQPDIVGDVIDPGPALAIVDFVFGPTDLTEGNHEAEIITVDAVTSKPDTFPDARPIILQVRAKV